MITIANLLFMGIIIGITMYLDKEFTPIPYSVITVNEEFAEMKIAKRGNAGYFCPNYCEVTHKHRAHKVGYFCGEGICGHYVFVRKLDKINDKRKNNRRTRH